jgi:ketosteroid isomerase-like protein
MKQCFSMMFILLFFCSSAVAQTSVEKNVNDAVERLRKAMVDGNGEVLAKLVADKLSYGHSSGHIDNKKEFIEKLVTGKSDFVSIELSEQTTSISGKTAIVRNTLHAITNDNGKPGEVNLKVMLVMQKQKRGWILLARQAVKIITP